MVSRIDKFCVDCDEFARSFPAVRGMISFVYGTHRFAYHEHQAFSHCPWCGYRLIAITISNGVYQTTVQEDGLILLHPELLARLGWLPGDEVGFTVKDEMMIVTKV